MQETHSAAAAPARRFSFDVATTWVLAATALLSIIAFFPGAATIPFLYTKVSIIAIGGLIALVLFILARLIRGNIIVPPVTLIGALWLVPVAYLLSGLFSGVGLGTAFFGTQLESDTLGFVLLLAAFGTLVALAFRRVDQYRAFFKLALVAYLIALVAQIVIFIVAKTPNAAIGATGNAVGSFVDLGMFVGLGIAISLLAMRFLTLGKRTQIVLAAAGVIGLLVLAIVNSPIVWSMVGLVALGLFIEGIMRVIMSRKSTLDEDLEGVSMLESGDAAPMPAEARTLAAPLATLLVSLFFLVSFVAVQPGQPTVGNQIAEAFGASFIDVRPSWQSTFDVGSHTYASSPIFGSGPGTFGAQWVKFRSPELNQTPFWNIDFPSGIGYIPTAFVTVGLLGALAWLAFLGLFIYLGLRSLLFRAPQDSTARFVAIASFTGALFVFALSFFTVPGPAVLLAGFVLAGLFISTLRYGTDRHEWGIIFAKNPRVGFVIVFTLTLLLLGAVIASYGVVTRYLAEVSFSKAVVALQANDLEGAQRAALASIQSNPSDRAYRLIGMVGMAQMNRIVNDQTLAPAQVQEQFQAALSTTVDASIAATRLNPKDYQNWVLLGDVYRAVVPFNIAQAYDSSKQAYESAVALNPTNPVLPFTLAQLEIANKNAPAAESYLNTAIGLKRDYTQAIFLLSQLQVAQGKAREALQSAEAAAVLAGNDPVVLFQVGLLRSGLGQTQGAIDALSRAVALNPSYANARFFLAVAYSIAGDYPKALEQLKAVAALSPDNAKAVEADIKTLEANKNPFPQQRLSQLGIPTIRDAAPAK